MALLVTEVLDYLEAQGLIAGATGWGRSAGYLPPDPDKVVAVYITPGVQPEVVRDGSTETAYDEPGFQVRGRSDRFGYEELETKMRAIYQALHGVAIANNYVLVTADQSAPLPMGMDENGRPGMTWNFSAVRER